MVGIYKKTAADIMTQHVATIRTKETVRDALLLMAENRLSALPVLAPSGACVGMVSQSDIIAMARDAALEIESMDDASLAEIFFGGAALEELTSERIDNVMSENVVTASPDDLVTQIADTMIRNEVHHIPVCQGNGQLMGIISTMDILSALRAPVNA